MCNYEQVSGMCQTQELENRINFLVQKTGKSKLFYLEQMDNANIDELEKTYLTPDVLQQIRGDLTVITSLAELAHARGWD
jgi:predicted DNA-binding protein